MHSKRTPRKLLGAWLPYARRNGTAGRPQQKVRHAYVETLRTLGFENNNFENWMNIAKDRNQWSTCVEHFLDLPKDSYSRSNTYCLKSFTDLNEINT